MSEPTPRASQATTPDPRLATAHIYLLVATLTGTAAIAVWLYDVAEPIHQGVFAVLRLVACVAACGYIVRAAEARVTRRIEHMPVNVDEARREAYAEGWVDGMDAARGSGEPARLRSVN